MEKNYVNQVDEEEDGPVEVEEEEEEEEEEEGRQVLTGDQMQEALNTAFPDGTPPTPTPEIEIVGFIKKPDDAN